MRTEPLEQKVNYATLVELLDQTATGWTKTIPDDAGFYWYREHEDFPEIVELTNQTDVHGIVQPIITFSGSDLGAGGYWSRTIDGEFWPIKLTPPQ